MAEAGEGEPKRCPCGFWGSAQTNNLCSKCYKECQQQRKEVATAAGTAGEPNATQLLTPYDLLSSGLRDNETTNRSSSVSQPSQPSSVVVVEQNQKMEEKAVEEREERETSSTNLEVQADKMNKEKDESDNFLPRDLPSQKNKKRCWSCKTKLELAQRALGECKCGYVFCFLHRLPEQHSCVYDHKEDGRLEALKTMVPASKKKFGRSFHRMDSRPEQ